MSDPLVRAFFIGRAVAETISEQFEATVTNTLSEIGKFDAEQRENIRQFANQVVERADREEEIAMRDRSTASATVDASATATTNDLQATIDSVRAEIARLRTELQQYRNSKS